MGGVHFSINYLANCKGLSNIYEIYQALYEVFLNIYKNNYQLYEVFLIGSVLKYLFLR